jgi:EmrB/QacA subfamily drug resistance transporter
VNRVTLANRLWWTIRTQWRVLATVLPGVAMAVGHSTMLNVPAADIIDALDTDRYRIHWISGSYILGSALGMALTGFASSRLGLRSAYLLGVLLFTIAGTACGFVSEVIWITPLRWIEGLGNGLILAAGMVLIWRAFPRRRETAMALYGMAIYVPCVAGSTIGGLLTTMLSWRLIFFSILPCGLVVFLLTDMLLPREPRPAKERHVKLDLVGIALLASSVVALNVMLDMAQYWGWTTSRHFVVWSTIFLVSIVGFVWWGLAAQKPLINLHVFRRENTTFGLAIKVIFTINVIALVTILSSYMVNLRGYQWWQAGLVLSPAIMTMPIAILFGIAIDRRSNRRLRMAVGLIVMALTTWQLSALDVYTSKFWIAGVMAVWGLGAGLVVGPALLTIFEALPIDETTMLAGVFNILRTLPAFAATVLLVTYWTQSTDAQFDTLRQNVRFNRPVVEDTYSASRNRFDARGSTHDEAVKQSQALTAKWTHANARAFALQDVMRALAMFTALGLIPVALVRRRNVEFYCRVPSCPVPRRVGSPAAATQ